MKKVQATKRFRVSLPPDHFGLYEHVLAIPSRRRAKAARALMVLGFKVEQMIHAGLVDASSVGHPEPVQTANASKSPTSRKKRHEPDVEPASSAEADVELMGSLFGSVLSRLRS
ncbi:hypothetical protein [Hydrogenophaga laconesensis]|uniref:Uncharacterized protein n=1 Tax=Hydrogenophaga laconesensis TaxID=1805971 RepID=A0ABU1VJB6_9BURK|nr:hypothetical protein [Hydrogenophaga laconesensis]MDR7097578.1 hypothetical protein [Hydrogenophaga laconesensis]